MRKAAPRVSVVCLLLGLGAFFLGEKPARAGTRGKGREQQKIGQALERARENKKTGRRLVKQILDDIDRTRKVLASVRTVVSARGSSRNVAALPDVCKTPTPAGPVPIPYPNIAASTDTSKGAKKVKADGKAAPIKGGEFAKTASTDEAGSTALLEHLRSVRSELEIRHDFIAGLCKNCKLRKADKRTLQEWLNATATAVRKQQARFDDYVRRIEQARRAHLRH